jgi:uncharacterized protein
MTTQAETALARFAKQYAVLLTTYRRDGTPVGTPVNIAVAGDRAYVRTFGAAWKAKRIRRNPDVELAPCSLRGRPTGPAVAARARLLEPGSRDDRRAARAIARKYPVVQGVIVPVAHRLKHDRTLHYEIRPRSD